MVSPNFIDDIESVQVIPPSSDDAGEGKQRKTRKSRKPNQKQLAEAFGSAIAFGNLGLTGWAGTDRAKQLWIFSEDEIDMEANALAELVLSYPTLYRYIAIVEKSGPMAAFMFTQWLIFGRKYAMYQSLMIERKQREDGNESSAA